MIIEKVQIQNFRLLKDFELDLKEGLSLVVGKNNCGKTSILTVMEKLLILIIAISGGKISILNSKNIFAKKY